MTSETEVPPETRDLLLEAYDAYNAQDLEALTALLADEVDWPDGERRLHGRDQVRAYWAAQWIRTRVHDRPAAMTRCEDGRVAVDVRQVVRDLDRAVVSTGSVVHLHRVDGGRLTRLDIVSPSQTT